MNNFINTKKNILFGQNTHLEISDNVNIANDKYINGNYGLLTLTDVWGELRYWIGEGVIRNNENKVIGNIEIKENTTPLSLFNEDDSFNIFWINNSNILSTLKIKNNELLNETIIFEDIFKFNLIISNQLNNYFIIGNNNEKWFVKQWNNLNNTFNILPFEIREQLFDTISYSQDGYFIFSPNGNKWINFIKEKAILQLFNFDICTGKITFIHEWFNQINPYEKIINVEWLNNDVLIAILNNKINCVSENAVYKFDILNNIIPDKLILLLDNGFIDLVLLQDNKIWLSKNNDKYLIWIDQNLNYDLLLNNNLNNYGLLPKFISNRNIGYYDNIGINIENDLELIYCTDTPNIEINILNTNLYTRFKWYRNGELLDDTTDTNKIIIEDGVYWIIGFRWTTTNNYCGNILNEEEYTDKFIIQKYNSNFNTSISGNKLDYCLGEPIQSILKIDNGEIILDQNNEFTSLLNESNIINNIKRKIQWYKNNNLILEDYETISLIVYDIGEYYVQLIEENNCNTIIKSNLITIRNVEFNIQIPEIKKEIPNCLNNLNNIKYFVDPIPNYIYTWLYNNEIISNNYFFYPYQEGEYLLKIKYNNFNCQDTKEIPFIVKKDDFIHFYIINKGLDEYCHEEQINTEMELIYNDMIIENIKWYKNGVEQLDNEINSIGLYYAQFHWLINDCKILLKTNEINIKQENDIKPNWYLLYNANKLYNNDIYLLKNELFYIYIDSIYNSNTWEGDINNLIEENDFLWKYEANELGNFQIKKTYYKNLSCKTCYYDLIININVIEIEEPNIQKFDETDCNKNDGLIELINVNINNWDIIWSNGIQNEIYINDLSVGNYYVKLNYKNNPTIQYYFTQNITTNCINDKLPELRLWSFNTSLCNNTILLETNFDNSFIFEWYLNGEPITYGIGINNLEINQEGEWSVSAWYQNKQNGIAGSNTMKSNSLIITNINWNLIKPFAFYNDIKYYNNIQISKDDFIYINIEGLNQNQIIIDTNLPSNNIKITNNINYYWIIKDVINNCQKSFYLQINIIEKCPSKTYIINSYNLNEQLLETPIIWYYQKEDCSNELINYNIILNTNVSFIVNEGAELLYFKSPINGNLLISNHPFEGWLVDNGLFQSNFDKGLWIKLEQNKEYYIPLSTNFNILIKIYNDNKELIYFDINANILNYKLYQNNNVIISSSNDNILFVYKPDYRIMILNNIIDDDKIYLPISL